jgi:hypothetical protein
MLDEAENRQNSSKPSPSLAPDEVRYWVAHAWYLAIAMRELLCLEGFIR